MKKLFLLIGIFLTTLSFAQWKMSFCNNVDDQKNLSGFDESFTVPRDGGYIYVVLETSDNQTMQTHKLQYDIFKNNKYTNSLYMDVEPDWTQCWKKVTFYDKGDYRIDVYDEEQYNDLLGHYGVWVCTGYVTIKFNE